MFLFSAVQSGLWLLFTLIHLLLLRKGHAALNLNRLSLALPVSRLANQTYWLILAITKTPLQEGLVMFGLIVGSLLQQLCFWGVMALWCKSWSRLRSQLGRGEWRTIGSLILFVAVACTLSLSPSSSNQEQQAGGVLIPSLTFRLAFWFWAMASLKGQLFAIKRYQRKLQTGGSLEPQLLQATAVRYQRLASAHLIAILMALVAMCLLAAEGVLMALRPSPLIPRIAEEVTNLAVEIILLTCLQRRLL